MAMTITMETLSPTTTTEIHRIPSDCIDSDNDDNNNNNDTDIATTGRIVRQRRVRFATNNTSPTMTQGRESFWSVLTESTCQQLWYQQSEIDQMKADVRSLVLRQQKEKAMAAAAEAGSKCDNGSDSNNKDTTKDEYLGLHRFSPQRAQWKRSAIYYILLAQKQQKYMHQLSKEKDSYKSTAYIQQFIRNVSKRCTGWAREEAVKQGFQDYIAVHDPLASLFARPTTAATSTSTSTTDADDTTENYNESLFGGEDGDISSVGLTNEDNSNTNMKRKFTTPTTFSTTETAVDEGRNVRRRVSTKEE